MRFGSPLSGYLTCKSDIASRGALISSLGCLDIFGLKVLEGEQRIHKCYYTAALWYGVLKGTKLKQQSYIVLFLLIKKECIYEFIILLTWIIAKPNLEAPPI